jgi:hypothetical protein
VLAAQAWQQGRTRAHATTSQNLRATMGGPSCIEGSLGSQPRKGVVAHVAPGPLHVRVRCAYAQAAQARVAAATTLLPAVEQIIAASAIMR